MMKKYHVCVTSVAINTYRTQLLCQVLPYTTLCSIPYKPDCTLCHVSLQKLWSKPQCSQNLSLSFQAYYSTTPTTMTQNFSVMLSAQCLTMSSLCAVHSVPRCLTAHWGPSLDVGGVILSLVCPHEHVLWGHAAILPPSMLTTSLHLDKLLWA